MHPDFEGGGGVNERRGWETQSHDRYTSEGMIRNWSPHSMERSQDGACKNRQAGRRPHALPYRGSTIVQDTVERSRLEYINGRFTAPHDVQQRIILKIIGSKQQATLPSVRKAGGLTDCHAVR